MEPGEEFVLSFLSHDTVYDPVKAHEYYMRTRELKGRYTGLRGKGKKEGWAYSKNVLDQRQKQAEKNAAETNRQAVTQLHEVAKQRSDEIRAKLKELMKVLPIDATNEAISQLGALPPIPKGASPDERAKLVADRQDLLAKINNDAKTKGQQTQAGAKAQLEQVHSDLLNSLDKAKQTFQAAKDALKVKYQAQLDKEFNYIKEHA